VLASGRSSTSQSPSRKRTFADSAPRCAQSCEKCGLRADKLEFKVRADGDYFQEEGDVSDVGILVDADDQFVRRCAELIEQASEAIRLPF
jgi:hypothetical protein